MAAALAMIFENLRTCKNDDNLLLRELRRRAMVVTMGNDDNDGVVIKEAIDGGDIDALWWRRR